MGLHQAPAAIVVELIQRFCKIAGVALHSALEAFVDQADGPLCGMRLGRDIAATQRGPCLLNRGQSVREEQANQLVSIGTESRGLDGQAAVGIAGSIGGSRHGGHQLIGLLFTNALAAIEQARAALRRGDITAKSHAAQRAISLVDEGLKGAVERNTSNLAESLYQLYDYCGRRLVQAHLKNDDQAFDEVANLLRPVQEAWQQIAPKADLVEG